MGGWIKGKFKTRFESALVQAAADEDDLASLGARLGCSVAGGEVYDLEDLAYTLQHLRLSGGRGDGETAFGSVDCEF